ncbi:MAG: hypothetical protein RR758_02395, partial [Burkholderiaceae bacterium]
MPAAPEFMQIRASSTVMMPLKNSGTGQALTSSFSCAGVLGSTVWPGVARAARPAESRSIVIATTPAWAAFFMRWMISSWVRGLRPTIALKPRPLSVCRR